MLTQWTFSYPCEFIIDCITTTTQAIYKDRNRFHAVENIQNTASCFTIIDKDAGMHEEREIA